MASTYIIVYPRGDRTKLSLAEICFGMEYEKSDYSIASRKEFYEDLPGAVEYIRELARKHDLSLELDSDHDFLD
jgi:hypothetical protein